MARTARIDIPELPYHVTHRGNRQGAVFHDEADRQLYLRRLARYASDYGLELWAYCLMTNHVHLILRPLAEGALARFIRELHGGHARTLNAVHSWDGHLWANRYYSAPLDQPHLWAAVRYVERNPVRAGLVGAAEVYAWSSARAHCGLASDGPLASTRPFPGPIDDWRSWLADGNTEVAERMLRASTARGCPAGSREFVARLEARLGRPLVRRPRGRPPLPAG